MKPIKGRQYLGRYTLTVAALGQIAIKKAIITINKLRNIDIFLLVRIFITDFLESCKFHLSILGEFLFLKP